MTANPNAVEGLREVVALVEASEALLPKRETCDHYEWLLPRNGAECAAFVWTRDHAPQLLAEVEALRADAERFRWLLENRTTYGCIEFYLGHGETDTRSAIDALRPTTETAAL